MKRVVKVILLVLVALIVVGGVGFGVYVSDYDKATQLAIDALGSTESVIVENSDDYIVYKPVGDIKCGLVFYPGGKVEPTVYSRVFSKLAESGIQTVVLKMPFNLAMFNINGAEKVLENYDDINLWYLGGHSLGGVFSTEYLKNNSEDFEGMMYLASYPSADISHLDIKVITINGTLDTVINREGYDSAKSKMPEDAVYYDIEGGNHTQFGDYNLQKGDTDATISAEEQQKLIVDKILEFTSVK